MFKNNRCAGVWLSWTLCIVLYYVAPLELVAWCLGPVTQFVYPVVNICPCFLQITCDNKQQKLKAEEVGVGPTGADDGQNPQGPFPLCLCSLKLRCVSCWSD